MSVLLPIAVFVPIVLGIIFLLPGLKKFQKWAGITTAVTLTAVTIILIIASIPVWGGMNSYYIIPWSLSAGLKMGFLMDNLSTLITLLIAVISNVTAFYSIKYMEHEENKHTYFALYNLFSAGMIGTVLATNLVEFLFFWELMLIPSYLLIVYWGTKGQAAKVGLKYFFYTQTGSVGIIIAFAFIGFYSNTFNMYSFSFASDIVNSFATSSIPNVVLMLSFVLLLVGFGIKMAVFPFQNWLPDAHGEAPTPISVLLSAVMIETASYAIVRFGMLLFGNTFDAARLVLEAFGAFTILYGGYLALVQTDIKRLLAYSSVSQMGYIFFGLATYNKFGVAGSLYHIIAHGFGKGILFMIAGIMMHELKTRDINQMGGLGRKMPLTAIIAFIGGLNLVGLPPLTGFFSEWMIFTGAIKTAVTPELIFVTIVLLLGSILSTGYILRLLWKVFLGPTPEKYKDIKEPNALLWVPAGILALLIVVLGIFANIIIKQFIAVGL